jgi:chromate transporter
VDRDNPYLTLIAVFAPFSLIAIGGGASIFAGIQHEAVEVRQWVTAREFIDLFALARGAPGPGSMLITLIGWKVAGWSGALVATAALFIPSCVLCYAVARIWNKHRGKHWHYALENGLAPLGTGLIIAGAFAILRLAGNSVAAWIVAGASAAILMRWPRTHPLVLLSAGGLAFLAPSLWMG